MFAGLKLVNCKRSKYFQGKESKELFKRTKNSSVKRIASVYNSRHIKDRKAVAEVRKSLYN